MDSQSEKLLLHTTRSIKVPRNVCNEYF